MNTVIVSWLGFNKDFIKVGKGFNINVKGPTVLIHEHLYKNKPYDLHYLLQIKSAKNSELTKKINAMSSYLMENYSHHKVIIEQLDIDEENLANYEVISVILRTFLNKLNTFDETDVITGTGSAIMHMAWVSLFYSMNFKFKLFLMHHNPERFPNPIPISLNKSIILDQKLKEYNLKSKIPENLLRDSMIEKTYEKAKAFAEAFEQNILILGATGTGKDLLAKFIKENSPLSDKPYEAINCASLPDDNLLQSELFGHEKGAFTGATNTRKGLFQKCNGGTLFMDEIGDMPMNSQLSLLRALENKEIKPLGSDKIINDVKVRIIAATNADLWEMCVEKKFRWDLYYRLCDCELELKPFVSRDLSGRKKIIDEALKQAENQWGRSISFEPEAKEVFYRHSFPGNFRELRRTINSLFALSAKSIKLSDLPNRFFKNNHSIPSNRQETEKQRLEAIYKEQGYNMAATARISGYSNPHHLKKKMENLGIKIHSKKK
jgi:DNA-binding NtrC family response regulator